MLISAHTLTTANQLEKKILPYYPIYKATYFMKDEPPTILHVCIVFYIIFSHFFRVQFNFFSVLPLLSEFVFFGVFLCFCFPTNIHSAIAVIYKLNKNTKNCREPYQIGKKIRSRIIFPHSLKSTQEQQKQKKNKKKVVHFCAHSFASTIVSWLCVCGFSNTFFLQPMYTVILPLQLWWVCADVYVFCYFCWCSRLIKIFGESWVVFVQKSDQHSCLAKWNLFLLCTMTVCETFFSNNFFSVWQLLHRDIFLWLILWFFFLNERKKYHFASNA